MRTLSVLVAIFFSLPAWAGDYKVTHLDKARVFAGTTLLADMSSPRNPRVVEVDFDGNILWQWKPERFMKGAVLDASLLDNGHILITVNDYGIVEVDRSGKVQWQHKDTGASHDADRLANGNTLYNRGWAKKGENPVVEIDADGREVWTWNGLEDYGDGLFADIELEGWMHVNSVSRLENGNTLVSMRNFNTVAEVGADGRVVRSWTFKGRDRKTGLKTKGPIVGARNHEPELLANGNIVLALRKPNRFVEFDTATQEVVWSWEHPDGDRALRTNREANRLPNGNTLGSAGNKLVEIAPDGTLVWQILAPGGDKNHRKFHKAIRIGVDGKAFGG